MASTAKAARSPKAFEIVANNIRRKILHGELKPGDSLPFESELISSLGVSRPTLREALRILEAEQLISLGRGFRGGAKIRPVSVVSASLQAGYALQAAQTTIGDVYTARLALEPFVIRLLAIYHTPEILQRLKAEIDQLERLAAGKEHAEFMMGVARFHSAIVEAFGNQTLILITHMLQQIVARYQVQFIKQHQRTEVERKAFADQGIASFKRLLTLIEKGEPDKAAAHWTAHLEAANRAWLRHGDIRIDMFDGGGAQEL